MTTPQSKLLVQFQRDFFVLAKLEARRTFGEHGLDDQIEQLRNAMNVKEAIFKNTLKNP